MKARLDSLEALRGFAAIYVVLHHAHLFPVKGPGAFFFFGQEAVILFFLLSGFVIYYSTAGRQLTVATYLRNRFLRIYPVFIAALILTYFIECAATGSLLNFQHTSFLANILMLQDNASLREGVWFDAYLGNSPLWSLAYEWWFYILFVPIGLTANKKIAPVHCAAIISLTGWLAGFIYPNQISNYTSYLFIWWAGVEFSREYVRTGQVSFGAQKPTFFYLGILALLQGLSLYLHCVDSCELKLWTDPVLPLRHYLASIAFLTLAIVWKRWHYAGFGKIFGPFKIFAPTSYAIYVIHQPLLNLFASNESASGRLLAFAIAIAITLALAWLLEIKLQPAIMRLFRTSARRAEAATPGN